MSSRLRLLWVTPSLPARGVSAARERFWCLLSRLARRHEITLISQVDPGDEGGLERDLPAGLANVELVPRPLLRQPDPLRLLPLTVRWGAIAPALEGAVARRLARERFDVVQWEFVEMGRIMPAPALPTVLTVHQLGFASAHQEWRAAGSRPSDAPVALFRHLRDLDFELAAARRAHVVVTMSPEDATRLRSFLPRLRLAVSPCGVDARFFQADVAPALTTDLLFVGNFEHPPNRDAVSFLVREVLGRLDGRTTLRIVGRAMTPDVAALAARPGVEVLSAVEDVRPHLLAARAVVAPVRFGTGMRGKVVEALAMGRPVVTTPLGAEGLGATPGEHLLIADGAGDWAEALRRILGDSELARRLGSRGRALAQTRFDWDTIAAAHESIYEEALRAASLPHAARFAGSRRLARRLESSAHGRSALVMGAALVGMRGACWHATRLVRS